MIKKGKLGCFICGCVFLYTSCKTISIEQETQKTTTQTMVLGTVGEQKDFVLEQDYNHTALPKYHKPIKLHPRLATFNKASYKAFSKAKTLQNQSVTVNYRDSLTSKPQFLKLEIADRVSVLNALNAQENRDVFQFLETKKEAHLITSISIAFNQNTVRAITNAEEVFLEASGIKSYAIKTYKNKELQQVIHFKEGVVFSYQTSSCCWKENSKYQLEIVDLVEGRNQCPDRAYRSSKRAKKNIDYFKF